jgi:hypothetical protein
MLTWLGAHTASTAARLAAMASSPRKVTTGGLAGTLFTLAAVLLAGCGGFSLGQTHFTLPRVRPSIPGLPVTSFQFSGYVRGTLTVPPGTLSCGTDASSITVRSLQVGPFGAPGDVLTITGLKPGGHAQFQVPESPSDPFVYLIINATKRPGAFYAGAPTIASQESRNEPTGPPAGTGQITVNASSLYGVVRLQRGTWYPQVAEPVETLTGTWYCR